MSDGHSLNYMIFQSAWGGCFSPCINRYLERKLDAGGGHSEIQRYGYRRKNKTQKSLCASLFSVRLLSDRDRRNDFGESEMERE